MTPIQRNEHSQIKILISQIDKLRNNHQCQLTEQQNEYENKCRDLENEFETRLSEQIADGLRRRQNLLDEFNKGNFF